MPVSERPQMADYGVPDDLEGVLPWSWAEERLAGSRNYWLVTASADARPHAMPVWGVWDTARERFVFCCSPNARKARNIAENQQVTVAVDDTVECVSLEGTARSVTGAAQHEAARAFGPKYHPDDPAAAAEVVGFMAGGTMFEVTPERAFGMIETEELFAKAATRWRWVRR